MYQPGWWVGVKPDLRWFFFFHASRSYKFNIYYNRTIVLGKGGLEGVVEMFPSGEIANLPQVACGSEA